MGRERKLNEKSSVIRVDPVFIRAMETQDKLFRSASKEKYGKEMNLETKEIAKIIGMKIVSGKSRLPIELVIQYLRLPADTVIMKLNGQKINDNGFAYKKKRKVK